MPLSRGGPRIPARMERAYRSDAFRLDAFKPAYLSLLRDRRLAERAETARQALDLCRFCPRACEAHRLEGHVGTCGIGRHAVVSSAFPHLGEEDCLRGRRGSGTESAAS